MVAFMYLYFDCLGFCLFGWFGVCLFICVYPINVMKRLNSVHDLALSRLGLWTFCEKLHFYHHLNIWIVEHYNFKYILRNWVFATNSDFLIPISLKPNVVNLWYFKLILFDLTELIVWNIKRSNVFEIIMFNNSDIKIMIKMEFFTKYP